jgi:hypothetical protein
VARKPKIEPEKNADPVESASGEPKKKPRPATTKPKAKKPAAKKKAPGAIAPTTLPAAAEPTDDAIRIRAYFLAERRMRLSLPGDSAHDWIEARRQLIEESGPASS